MKKKMTEMDYKLQYLSGWESTLSDVFTDKKVLKIVMKIKEKQFDLNSYKKSLKRIEKLNKELSKGEESDFFADL